MSVVGEVQNGAIVFQGPIPFSNGTRVRIEPIEESVVHEVEQPPSGERRSFLERYREFVGIANDLPTDMADQHDHYLYGTPKK